MSDPESELNDGIDEQPDSNNRKSPFYKALLLMGLLPTPVSLIYFQYRFSSGAVLSEHTLVEYMTFLFVGIPSYMIVWMMIAQSLEEFQKQEFKNLNYGFVFLLINYGLIFSGCTFGGIN